MSQKPDIVPYLSYRDPRAAIAFLQTAFGLQPLFVVDGEDGGVVHAEMRFGNGVLMIGTDERQKGSPGLYLVVDDVDGHYQTAEAAGATIVYPPQDTEFGTRRYRARDPEGHEWSFGSYRPQTEPPDWT